MTDSGSCLCGCCETAAAPTPALIVNQPGLPAVVYRIGTFASFREAMLRAVGREPALAGLTTRRSDDPAITLLELWAAVADVLTFYQERIANEAFLRTARERDSVLRLVRVLDYHLRPGLAATTRLAFTAQDGAAVRIPVGLRVMSTPGQDERPQIFETVEAIRADFRLNRLPVLPQATEVNPLAQGRQTAFLTADNAGWQAAKALMPGDRVVLWQKKPGAGGASLALHHSYAEVVGWNVPLRVTSPPPAWGAAVDLAADLEFWSVSAQPVFAAFPALPTPDPDAPEEKEIKEVRVEGDRFLLVWSAPVVKSIWSAATEARVFTARMNVFGYDAPATFPTVSIAADGTPSWGTADAKITLSGATLPLDRLYKDLKAGEELLVYEKDKTPLVVTVTGVADGEEVLGAAPAGIVDNRHRGKVTRVTVDPALNISNRRDVNVYRLKGAPIPLWPGDFAALIDAGRLYVPAARLDAAGEALEIGRTIVGRELKPGVAIRLTDIEPGRQVLLEDHTGVPTAAEITGRSVDTVAGQDFLVLDVTALSPIALETRSAVLLGNVARATHGESVRDEALGDGDAAAPFQRFALRKKPLTYTPSAESARGAAALRVLVNGERWDEVPSLYGQPAASRVYTVRQADDGTTVLQFGDGASGSRLPSGRGNVAASYRQGSGLEGRLKAGQLNILLDRPVGLKEAVNPTASEGGADPEILDRAREVAPTTVRTFGRAVSLLDFEWLVLESGQVAKARATWVWMGLEKAVHLTVAGQKGGLFSPEELRTLHSALTHQRDPNRPLLLANVSRVPLVVTATLRVDGRFVRAAVLDAARRALLAAFDFDAVGFAQPVHLSDVYRVLQDVTGVDSVDIDVLHFKGYESWTAEELTLRGATARPDQPHLRLFAARAEASGVIPAEQAYIQNAAEDVQLTATGGLD
jgi:hypothetical protein